MNQKMITGLLLIALTAIILPGLQRCAADIKKEKPPTLVADKAVGPWAAPDSNAIPHSETGDEIRYGRELIAHTSWYLGPNGKVAHISNGMNCQNCHLAAGTKPWGNNFSAVLATYPKYRDRSGGMESIVKRINDCFERSLNGKVPDSNSREMRAMIAYIHWVGTNVPKGKTPEGSGITSLKYLDRATDPEKGKIVFLEKCQSCHGPNGAGMRDTITGVGYLYPPLWGSNSFNVGAGLYRVSRLAGYVKENMPFGASHTNPQLTDEQAWDVAAFINSQPRPFKDFKHDWPDKSTKPVDHPFGPYADSFTERQHKFGPFSPIQKFKEASKRK